MSTVPPSSLLDAAIHKHLVGHVLQLPSGFYVDGGGPVPAYTSSVDAAISLCGNALPGFVWRLTCCTLYDDAWLMPDFNHPQKGDSFKANWPGVKDPLSEGPGLDLSLSPAGRPALALVTCLLAVIDGIRDGRRPHDDGREIQALDQEACEKGLSAIEHIPSPLS